MGGASGGGSAGLAGAGKDSGAGAGTGGTSGGSSGQAACPASATASPDESTKSVMIDGRERGFILHIPQGYTGNVPVPVVIDFHPLGGTGSQQKNATGWSSLPGAEANLQTWGDLNMCTGSPEPLPGHAAGQAYPMCGGDVDTVLCTVQNGNHCGSYQSFGIVNIAWEMFQTEALP